MKQTKIVRSGQVKQVKSNGTLRAGAWDVEEIDRFIDAIRTFGKDWPKITEKVGTRTKVQVASFA